MNVRLRWRDVRAASLGFLVGTVRSRRYSRSPLGLKSESTQNVSSKSSSVPREILTLSKAVVIANVLGFFDPIRALIQNAVGDGFIRPVGKSLIKFVDGPADYSLHETFDWGKALLEEIELWEDDPSYSLGFKWTKSADSSTNSSEEETEALWAT
jgi:hypothetical protein